MVDTLTWNPVFRLTSFLASSPEAISESSEAFTLFDVLALLFFLEGAARRVLPPRVGRAREFSSACSLAAKAASASKSLLGLYFLVGGVALTDSAVPSLDGRRFTGDEEADGDGAAFEAESGWPLLVEGASGDAPTPSCSAYRSKRSIISCLMAPLLCVS